MTKAVATKAKSTPTEYVGTKKIFNAAAHVPDPVRSARIKQAATTVRLLRGQAKAKSSPKKKRASTKGRARRTAPSGRSAYFIFSQEKRGDLLKKGMKVTEAAQELGSSARPQCRQEEGVREQRVAAAKK
jgi:hypothetical protein